MIVCPDYDKFEFTETDLELVNEYGRQISSVDVEFCQMIKHLEAIISTIVHNMPNTKLRDQYGKALFEVVKACYRLDKVLMNEEVPSWYIKENHVDGDASLNRTGYTDMLEEQLKDDLFQYMDDDLYDEIENDRNMRKLKNENKS